MEKQKIYCDMDGVVAEWNTDASIEEVASKGYFRECRVVYPAVKALEILSEDERFDVCICSSIFNDDHSKQEKLEWLKDHMPFIKPENIHFAVYGEKKSASITERRPNDILIDDFSKNLKEWHGIGIKFLNGINGTKGTWKGFTVSGNSFPLVIANTVRAIAGLNIQEAS